MQSKQGIVDSLLFGQGPGSAVRMDGSGFDPSTAAQKGIEAFGTTTPGLAAAMMGPLGLAAGTTYGFTQVKGELDKDTGAGIDAFYASGRLQQSPAFKSLIADGVSEADAVQTLKQRARDESAAFAGVLGGGATALEAGLLRTGAPGMLATPVIEALQEGPGESLASNQILGSVLGFDTPLSRAEILENMTAGGLGGGGASAVAPLAGGSTQAAPVLDPSQSPTAGQPAQSTVPTSYDQTPAEELMLDQLPEDSLFGDSSMSGVGDIAADARIMASEMLADQQIVFDADNNILTNKETNESFQIDPKVTPILDATTEIILGGTPAGARAVPTPVSAQTNVENLPAPGQDGPLGITFQGSRDLKSAVDQKLNEGSVVKRADGSVGPATTPVSLPAQNEGIAPKVDPTSVGKKSIDAKEPSGIEQVVAKGPDAIIADQRAAAPELTTIYHATKGAPFSQFDPTQGDSYYGNQGAFGPGFYGSLDTKYPSEFVGGEGSLMSAQVDTSNMLDARNKKPLSQTQTANLQGALANRTDSAGNNLNVTQDGNILTVEYVRKSSFAGESEADRTVTRTIDTTNPTDVFQKVNIISENIKNPLAKDDRGLSIESELDGDTQNLKDILTDAGFTGVVGVADVGGGTAGNKDNMVVFDESLVGDLQTVVDQGPIPTSAADLAITNKMDADNATTEVKLPVAEETAAVVTEKADGSADVELSEGSTSKTVVEKDGDSKTTRKTGATVTETDTGATVELPAADQAAADQAAAEQAAADQAAAEQAAAEQAAAEQAAADQTVAEQVSMDQDVFAEDQVEQEAAATAAEQAAADAAAATETQTASTVAVSQVTDDDEEEEEEEEVEVEVEEEVEPGGDVTVDLDEDDTFVPVITSTDENGETITECPEGYVMVEGPDGPMCQKSVTATRQRAGAGTRAYTGLAGNIGRTGPGQRRKTTTLTERVRPTVRSA
jgi:hypothetical protein